MIPILQTYRDYNLIKRSNLFDAEFYLLSNPDVRRADVSPLKHFVKHGWKEGRNPSKYFDVNYYLETYPDVREVGVNPLYHYLEFGWLEGRNPTVRFDTNKYLDAYPDVRLRNQNPLDHYLKRGKSLGYRAYFVDEIVEFTQPQSVDEFTELPQPQPVKEKTFDIDQYLSYLEEQTPVISDLTLAERKKISVIVTSYNHERYIQQCLDSILMQKGNFDSEIIVGDDCSSDGTMSIFEAYRSKFPQLIRILPNKANLGITKNLKRCFDACSGDYIAICEGDDYWIDQYKLQKQMDRLEKNADLSMCFSAIILYYEKENKFVAHNEYNKVEKEKINSDDLIEYNYVGNFSCCMYRRKTIINLPKGLFDIYTVDWMLNITCGEVGAIGYLSEYMSVYRLHDSGSWTGRAEVEKLTELATMIDIYDNFLNLRHHTKFSILKENIKREITRIEGLKLSVKKTNLI